MALELPLPASAIRWLGLASSAAPSAPDSMVLQGNFSATVFGVEERVQATPDGVWRCSVGSQPAGLVLGTRTRWEGAQAQELELQIEGDGALQLAVADAVRE